LLAAGTPFYCSLGVITAAGLPGAAAPPLGRPSTPRCTPMRATIRAGPGSLSPALRIAPTWIVGAHQQLKTHVNKY